MKWEAIWEVAQTALPFLFGRLLGTASKDQSKTGGVASEAPLKQQVTSILSPRNDEAVQFAVDAALRRLSGGKKHLANVQAVRDALKVHQRTSWREFLAAHEMTERFENVTKSVIVTRPGQATNQNDPSQPPQQQKKQSGQEKIEMGFERRAHDYELTAEDPRVQHLVLVSQIVSGEATLKNGAAEAKVVSAEATLEKGVAKATAYLLSAGLISELSPQEKAAAAAKKAKDVSTQSLYQWTLSGPVMDEVRRQEQVIEAEEDPATRKDLRQRLETYIVTQSRAENTKANGRLLMAFGWFVGILAFLFVIGLIVAASLKSN